MTARATAKQQVALNRVSKLAGERRRMRAELEALLRARLVEELEAKTRELHEAVRHAYRVEKTPTPKVLIMGAYGTTDRHTINDILASEIVLAPKQPSIVVDAATQTVTVNWFEFSDGDYIDESCTFDWDQENENLSWAWDGPDKIESAYSEKAIQNFAFAIELNAAVRKAWLG